MQQVHHHYYPDGGSSSASASRCPALRAAAEQRNYQLPAASSTRGSVQYDPVHGHPGNRNVWHSRGPQNWRPAMIPSPFAQDPMTMGTFPGQTLPNQPSSQQPPCPMPNAPGASTYSDSYLPSFQVFRPTMHPAPRLGQTSYQNQGGFTSSNPNHSNTQHPSNRPNHRTNNSLHTSDPAHSVPAPQVPSSSHSPAPVRMGQMTSLGNESNSPGQQLPNLLPHIFPQQSNPSSFSLQTPETVAHATSTADEDDSRPGKLSSASR